MSKIYICGNGHRWDEAKFKPRAGHTPDFCPVCGGKATRLIRAAEMHPTRHATTPPPIPVSDSASPGPAVVTVNTPPVPAAVTVPAPAAAPAMATPSVVPPVSTTVQWSKVDVAPSLPMSVFTSSERWNSERIGAMAIYCSDGRWGDAFDEFCHRSLLIPRYDRFAVPGGPGWVNKVAAKEGDVYNAAREQLDYLVHCHELERIILITHFSCGFYNQELKKEPEECLPAQYADVKKAADTLRQWYDGMKVEGYLAMRSGTVLSFHRLD